MGGREDPGGKSWLRFLFKKKKKAMMLMNVFLYFDWSSILVSMA